MNQAAHDAIQHYMYVKKLTKDVATGIVGVLMNESALNPLAVNNSGTDAGGVLNRKGAIGLEQANGPRQAGLANFAKSMGEDWRAMNTQLDYVLAEAAKSYPQVWRAINQKGMTYQRFIPIFVDYFEDPANKRGEINNAMNFAKQFYAYQISPPTASPAT